MKKIYIKQLLTAILLLCSVVVNATVYSGTCGTNVNWSLDTETGVLEITGTGAMYEHHWSAYSDYIKYVSIGNGVTNIGNDAFYYCESLTSITIPNSVTTIGQSTFEGCDHLTSIEIPNSVTTIGERAFYNCSGLTSIEIPNSVTTIEENAFTSCDNLTSIIVESGNTKYDSRDNCNAIIETAINTLIAGCAYTIIPNSVTTIGQSAFAYCTSLASISIPNSVTKIGEYAFNGCWGLTSITIPNSVTTIGQSAFRNCTSLASISIPNSVTMIGQSAFEGCWGLTSVTIPNSVTTIESKAFEGCTGLTSIEIPNSVTAIGIQAFENCTSLTSISIPNSVTSIGASAFYNTAWYNNQPNGAIYAGKVFYEYKGIMDDTSIIIKEGTLGIAIAALYGCTGLTSITIPNSVTTIGQSAFENCTSLEEIYSLAETPATIGSYTFNDYSATLYVPAGAKAAYQAADYWKNFTNIVEMTPTEETPTEVTITIGQYGTATYCSPYALDFSKVEGLKAYTATGYNSSTGVVTLTRAQTAEDATGLFLMGEPGEYTVPVIEYSSDYMLNMLVGTLEATAVNNKTDDGNYINFKYTIGSESSQPMFYQFEDGSTLSAGKAYLQLPARLFTTTASKSISLRFDDGQLTDIDRVESESNDTQTIIYDLCGRRVSKPAKGGIYIKNGKKIIL